MTAASEDAVRSARESAPGSTANARLRDNRDFQVVLTGQAVSAFGDAISLTVVPLLVLSLTGSAALMGLVGALELLPMLVVGLPAGALADRWDRRRIMLWADAGQAVLTSLIPASMWLGWPTMTVILIVIVPIHALRTFGAAGFSSVVPGLVGREQVGRASGYLEATLSASFIVGPAIAGVLVATIGPAMALAVDAASFAVSAASLTLVRRPLRADRPAEPMRLGADIAEGLRFVAHHPVLRPIVAYWSVVALATTALLPALAFYITVDRHLGPEVFGLVGSVWSAGFLVGSLLAGRLGDRWVGRWMLASGAVIGLCLVAIALTPLPALYLVAAFAIGAALSVALVSFVTLRAAVTPDELLGRVGSTTRTLSLGLRPLGMLAGGAVIAASTGGMALAGMGALALAASLLCAMSPQVRDAGHRPVVRA